MHTAKRVETVARAMARYRLGAHMFSSSLNPDLIAKVIQGAEDRLWRSLIDEAEAVVEAIDALGRDATDRAGDRTPPHVAQHAPDLGSAIQGGGVGVEQNKEGPQEPQHPAVPMSDRASADPAAEGLRSALAVLRHSGRS